MDSNRNYLFAATVQAIATVAVGGLTAWVAFTVAKVGNEAEKTKDAVIETKAAVEETKEAAVEIKHSVNSAQSALVERDQDFVTEISALKETIKELMIERASTTPKGEATATELQSDKPLP